MSILLTSALNNNNPFNPVLLSVLVVPLFKDPHSAVAVHGSALWPSYHGFDCIRVVLCSSA
jgi:hypothetical protein